MDSQSGERLKTAALMFDNSPSCYFSQQYDIWVMPCTNLKACRFGILQMPRGRDGQKHLKKILAPQTNKSTSPLMHVWNTALFHKPNRYTTCFSLHSLFLLQYYYYFKYIYIFLCTCMYKHTYMHSCVRNISLKKNKKENSLPIYPQVKKYQLK